MSNYVQPTEYINYISEFKKIFINRNNMPTNQLFKIDSNISDEYYFQIISKNNQIVDLSGRTFQIYGSIEDSKNIQHILFFTENGTIEQNNVLHFHINTYNQQYLAQIKTNKQANITIVETTGNDTQVVLRDVCLCYKRPYIDNVVPAEIYTVRILTGSLPWQNEFGAGQNINLIEGTPNYAFGSNLSTASNQFVVGDTNTPDATKAFIVANSGNVFTVDYDGNIEANSINATSLFVDGEQVATDSDLTGLATKNDIEAVSAAIPSVEGFATEQWVQEQGYLTAHQDLTAYATKDWVEGKGYITGVNLDPYATKDQLTAYATKTDLTVSASVLNNQISQLALNIPTKVSDLTNDSGFITGYTAGTGISISNQNVISIDGELGKTYYADETTLHLNDNNTFSVKSIRTKLNNGPGISLIEDGNGVVTITNTGGSGGSGGYVYTNGTGLGLSTVTADQEYQFYVDEAWLNTHIDAYTSGLHNYTAGTGIAISNENVISVTGMVTSDQIADMATKTWVGQQGFLTEHQSLSAYATSAQIEAEYAKKTDIPETSAFVTSTFVENAISGKADLSSVYTKEEVYTYIETDAKINQATSGKADKSELSDYATESDLQIVSAAIPTSYVQPSEIADMATTGWVTDYTSAFITSGDIPQTLTKVSQLQNDVGYITITSVPDVTGFATKSELQTVSSTIEGEIPDVSNLASKNELETVSTALVEQIPSVEGLATEADLQIVSAAIPSLVGYATESYVTQQVSGKANSADVYTKNEVYTKGETDSAIETASASIINQIPSVQGLASEQYVDNAVSTASGNLQTAINGKTTSGEVKTQIEAYGYQTATDVANAITGKADKSELTAYALSSQVYSKTEVNNISTNIVSQIPSIEGLATESYVQTEIGKIDIPTTISDLTNDSEFATSAQVSSIVTGYGYITDAALTDYAQLSDIPTGNAQLQNTANYITSAEIPTSYVQQSELESVSGQLTNAIGAKANTTQVEAEFTATSAWANETFLTEHQSLSSYYTKSEVDSAIGTATNDMATQSWVEEQGYLTAHQSLDNYYNKTQVDTISSNIVSQIPTDVATSSYVQAASGNAVSVATGWVNDQNYITETELATELEPYALSADVTTAITNATSGKVDQSTVEGLSTQLSTAIDTKANSADVYTKSQVYTKGETDTAINTATSGKVNKTDFDTVTGALSTAIDTKVTSAQVSSIVTGFNYLSSITVSYSDDGGSYTYPVSGIDFGQGFVNVSDYGDNIAHVSWKGLHITDYEDYNFDAYEFVYNPNDFFYNDDRDGLQWLGLTVGNNRAKSFTFSNDFEVTFDQSEETSASVSLKTISGLLSAGNNITLTTNNAGVTTIAATGGGGGGSTYTAGDGIDITNDEISVDQTWFETNVSSLVSGEIDSAASAAVENYIELSGLATGTGLYYDDTDNSLNINLSADANSNMVVSADNNGVVWLSSMGGGSTYTAGDYISLANDTIAVTGLPTNQQTISTGFTYDSSIQIYKNAYTPTNGVITLSAFEVPAGSLDSNKVATFEEQVYTKSTLTGISFNGVTLTNELPQSLAKYTCYVFRRTIFGNGKQLIHFEYQFDMAEEVPLTLEVIEGPAQICVWNTSDAKLSATQYSLNGAPWIHSNDFNTIFGVTFQTGDVIELSCSQPDVRFVNAIRATGTNVKVKAYGNPHSMTNWDGSKSCQDLFHAMNETLVDVKDMYISNPIISANCYDRSFQGSDITEIIDFNKFYGIKNTATYCFNNMYSYCNELTSIVIPNFSTENIPNFMFFKAFEKCTGLLSAVIELETISKGTLHSIFDGCTSLHYIEVNFTNWNAYNGFYNWVNNVSPTGTFVKPATLPEEYGVNRIPSGWTVVNK